MLKNRCLSRRKPIQVSPHYDLFFSHIIWFIKSDRSSFAISSLFSNNYFEFTELCWNTCGLFRARAMDPNQISCRVFSQLEFFFRQVFLASVLTVFFVNCRSARLFYFIYHMFECSITYCYISRCTAETAKVKMVFRFMLYWNLISLFFRLLVNSRQIQLGGGGGEGISGAVFLSVCLLLRFVCCLFPFSPSIILPS